MLGSARHDVDCAARLLPGENATVVFPAQVLIAVGSLRNSDGSESLHSGVPLRLARWLHTLIQGPEGTSKTASNDAKGKGRRARNATSDEQAQTRFRRPFVFDAPEKPKQSTVWNNSKLLISRRDLSTAFDKVDPLAHIRLVSPADQAPFAAHAMRDGNRSAIMAVG